MASYYTDLVPRKPGEPEYIFPTEQLREIIARGGTGNEQLDTMIMEILIDRENWRTAALS